MNNMNVNPLGMALDTWVESIGSLCWAQDQSEQIVKSWMDQGKLAREQGQDLARQLSSQAKKNQVELQKFIHNTVSLSMDSLQRNHQNQMAEMENRVKEMTELVTTLQKKVEDIQQK